MNEASPLLIVDDEPDYLDEMLEALAFDGIRAVAVSSAPAAADVLASMPGIRVVVTDIRMPHADGIELIGMLRRRFPGRKLHFLVMTGHAAEEDIGRARSAGAECFLPKPLVLEDLRHAIRPFLV